MKKLGFVLLFVSAFLLCGSMAQAKENKIGYIELQKVFANSKEAQEKEKIFKKEVITEQSKISDLQEKIKKMQKEFETKKDLMKPAEKKKKEEEMQQKIQEFSNAWKNVNQKLDNKRKEIEKSVFDKITKIVKEYGKKYEYKLIVDSRVVLFGQENADLTEDIIKALNTKK